MSSILHHNALSIWESFVETRLYPVSGLMEHGILPSPFHRMKKQEEIIPWFPQPPHHRKKEREREEHYSTHGVTFPSQVNESPDFNREETDVEILKLLTWNVRTVLLWGIFQFSFKDNHNMRRCLNEVGELTFAVLSREPVTMMPPWQSTQFTSCSCARNLKLKDSFSLWRTILPSLQNKTSSWKLHHPTILFIYLQDMFTFACIGLAYWQIIISKQDILMNTRTISLNSIFKIILEYSQQKCTRWKSMKTTDRRDMQLPARATLCTSV